MLSTIVVDKPTINFLRYELKYKVLADRKVFNNAGFLEKYLPPNFVYF